MRRRQPPPRLWLMTDERADASLDAALLRLPRGAGVVFRHHATPPPARWRRYRRVRAIARRRGLVLVLAGSAALAAAKGADGAHGPPGPRGASGPLLRTASAHDARELGRASAADIVFLSPVFPTRSHPGGRALGPVRFGILASRAETRVVALGGMTPARGRRLRALGAWGWAAIDAWAGALDVPGAKPAP